MESILQETQHGRVIQSPETAISQAKCQGFRGASRTALALHQQQLAPAPVSSNSESQLFLNDLIATDYF